MGSSGDSLMGSTANSQVGSASAQPGKNGLSFLWGQFT